MCRRYLYAHLYSDGGGWICNVCVKKSSQRGGATAYKTLLDTIEEHVIEGGDDQSLEFFIHSNLMHSDAISTTQYTYKIKFKTIITFNDYLYIL